MRRSARDGHLPPGRLAALSDEVFDPTRPAGPGGGPAPHGGFGDPPSPFIPPPPPPPPWAWRKRAWLLGLAAFLLVVPALGAAFVRVPYFLISPGEARGVTRLIVVDDPAVEVFHPEGDILFTTVSLTGNVNLYEALWGWLDDEVDVVPESQITGGQPRDEVRRQNIRAMDDSKLVAIKVALERLGQRVSIEGSGALVTLVNPGDPADGRLREGDVIVGVDGEAVALHEDVVSAVRRHQPGDVIEITLARDGTERTIQLTAADNGEGEARIGVVLQTYELTYKFPIKVSIDTGEVGGPSAGLAFTLALIDELTPGELTGGRLVAVTGTMDVEGRVGLVGGVPQKTVTARRAGADVFLVPPGEADEARLHAGDMRIVGVATLDDALAALEELGGSGVALPTGPAGS